MIQTLFWLDDLSPRRPFHAAPPGGTGKACHGVCAISDREQPHGRNLDIKKQPPAGMLDQRAPPPPQPRFDEVLHRIVGGSSGRTTLCSPESISVTSTQARRAAHSSASVSRKRACIAPTLHIDLDPAAARHRA